MIIWPWSTDGPNLMTVLIAEKLVELRDLLDPQHCDGLVNTHIHKSVQHLRNTYRNVQSTWLCSPFIDMLFQYQVGMLL